jgi:glycosyltransferase involved in cell wall biosynthesis
VERVQKGVDAALFQPSGPSLRSALRLQSKRVVITVARLVPLKNLRLLLDAIAIARERVPDVHLIVVGDGPEARALKDYAINLDLSDCVTFAGYIAQADTPDYYRAADLFALSSDFDNSPNVLLEAMACGLPIVTTDVGGVRDFVADPVGGLVVPPRDAGALASAIGRYLVAPEARREAGAYNRSRVTAEFTWRASALRLLDVYRQVIAARGGATRA